MARHKSIKFNFVMNALLTMSSFIFPLITFPYVSRILLPTGTGRVSFATSLISYFTMFSQLGIPTYGIRICSKVRDDKEELSKTVHELLVINLATTVISYILLVTVLVFIPRLYEDRVLYAVMSVSIFLNAIGMEWLYKALEQYSYITIRSIVCKFVALVGMFFFIKSPEDYVFYGVLSIFAASASNILNFINARKYIIFKPIGCYNFRCHLKPIAVFFAMSCATTIYTHLDTVMLGFMASDEEVGFYNAAVKIKHILVSVVTSLGAVLLPRASYYIEQKKMNEFKIISRKALNFVLVVAPPMVVYFILFAKQSVFFLSGNNYEGSILPMRIIMPTLLLIGLSNISGIQMLIPMGRENVVLYSEVAGAVINLILNAFLIPQYAAVGAAIGTVVAEATVLMVQCIALRDWIIEYLRKISYIKLVIGIVIGSISSIWILWMGFNDFLALMISAIIFFGVYGVILIALKEPFICEVIGQIKAAISKKTNNKRN